jgi:4-diphosphocytidyl-2-C-methyl-D-erythritol kinase
MSTPAPTIVRSYAKINLGLFLGPSRPDGFHALTTVYQTLEMHDLVTVTAKLSGTTALRITSNDPRVPTTENELAERNTVWKMVTMALDALETSADVEIHIDKRLPVQGGLGAGSGNAVAALVGLDAELGTSFRSLFTRKLEFPAKVGSDVPLFLVGGTVLGVDRGQEVYPLPDIEPTWCVIAVPEIGVSTPQAFRDWDALCAAEGLTAEAGTARLEKLSRNYASAFRGEIPEGGFGNGSSGVFSAGEDLAGPQEATNGSALVRTGIMSWIENDFERVIFPQHPSLAEIKRLLAGSGTPEAALLASLSGSGSALFGLYLTRGDAEAAVNRITNEVQNLGVRSTAISRTIPRSAYWKQMLKNVD